MISSRDCTKNPVPIQCLEYELARTTYSHDTVVYQDKGEDISEDVSEDISEDSTDDISEDIAEDIAKYTAEYTTEDTAEGITEDTFLIISKYTE